MDFLSVDFDVERLGGYGSVAAGEDGAEAGGGVQEWTGLCGAIGRGEAAGGLGGDGFVAGGVVGSAVDFDG